MIPTVVARLVEHNMAQAQILADAAQAEKQRQEDES